MTVDIIIQKFEDYTGDTSEQSSFDELDLANKIYHQIQNDRAWEWLKKTASGTVTVNGTTATITVPTDFAYFVENHQMTNIAHEPHGNASPKVIFLATATGVYQAWQIINFSDRRQFLNQQGFAYYDALNNIINLTAVPNVTDMTYEFDYIYTPPDLVLLPSPTAPVFPAQFHDMIYHAMAADDMIIQLFDRAHTYAQENMGAYTQLLNQMRWRNAELQNF